MTKNRPGLFFVKKIGLAYFLLLLPFISGCEPTYNEENIAESARRICREEYGTDVKIRRIGNTLGVYMKLDKLFDMPGIESGGLDLNEIASGFKLAEGADKKIGDVTMAASRVCISSDCDVEFYVVVAEDESLGGAQVILTRHVMDIKRILTGDISRGDFVQRMLIDIAYDSRPAAEALAKEFFEDLQSKNAQEITQKYFAHGRQDAGLSGIFFMMLNQVEQRQDKTFALKSIKSMRLSPVEVMTHCEVEEAGGLKNTYLILTDTSLYPLVFIRAIIPSHIVNANGTVNMINLEGGLTKYKDPQTWQEEDFFLEEVRLPIFLARQIGGRIRNRFAESRELASNFALGISMGEYLTDNQGKKFFKFTIEPKLLRSPTDQELSTGEAEQAMELVQSESFEVICRILRRYEFKDFDRVEFVDIANANTEIFSKDEMFDRYKPRRLFLWRRLQ